MLLLRILLFVVLIALAVLLYRTKNKSSRIFRVGVTIAMIAIALFEVSISSFAISFLHGFMDGISA